MSYFAQNGMKLYVDGGVNGPDDPPEDEDQGTGRLSFPKRVYFPETPMTNLFKEGTDAYKKREDEIRRARYKSAKLSEEEMKNVMFFSDPDGTEYTGQYDTPSSVTPIKEPTQQSQVQTQQPQGGTPMPTSAERKYIQRYYESSNNPSADSGYAGGLYGIAEGALTDAIKDGIVPEGSDVYDAEVNEKVRDYYIDKMYNAEWVKNATTNVSRLARAYSGYNQGGGRAVEGWNAAKKAGYDINPKNADELVALMDAKGGGEYDGYFWPKETRDYVKGIVAGQFDPSRLPEGFQLGQMEYGGKMALEGTKMGEPSPTIEELALAKRLREMTGKDTSGFVRLAGDVDFSKLSNLSDEQLGALYSMADKYSKMFKGKGDGASGVVTKLRDEFGNIRSDLDQVAEVTGLDRDEIKEIGYDIIDANPGDKMGFGTRVAAKTLLHSLKRGGRLGNI